MNNLFSNLPLDVADEHFQVIAANGSCRIERIVSHGHASPPGFWYDQDQHEWVVVLRGAARIQIEGQAEPLFMKPGDYINIPAHQRHRVEWTAPDEPTIWLAVHFGQAEES